MSLNIFNNTDGLNEALAQKIIAVASEAITNKGRFDFVLTGGSSPKALYQLLSKNHVAQIDWTKVYFFFGDERTVSPDHKDYNGLMAKENLFDNLDLKPEQLFYVDTTLSPSAAAKDYQEKIEKHFDGKPIIFDFILLGMGDDAHTASIFPETTLTTDPTVGIKTVFVEKLDTYRISFTAPLINQAKYVAFITFGENKADALRHILKGEMNTVLYPSQLIKPESGNLDWFVDEKAASLLA